MTYGIKIVGTPEEAWDEDDWLWLESYDPDAENGVGLIEATPHSQDAMKFSSSLLAMQTYTSVSKKRPRRTDGQPNRPLTAFSVLIEKVEDSDVSRSVQ